jgi:hypothetical protein
MVWEANADGPEWIERVWAPFGAVATYEATDSFGGMAACFARDLDAFRAFMRERAAPSEPDLERLIALRRAGTEAATLDDAVAAARKWASAGGETP